jgi:16S rRNA processing protein RimM
VATVRKPHGIRGELLVALETDRPREVFRAGRVLRVGDAAGRDTGRRLTVERARPFQDGLLLKAAEFQGRTPELEEMRGRTLLIPAGEAAPADADEIHYRELLGMAVLDGESPVGVVAEVRETPGGELLVVARERGGPLLVPFVAAWLRGVDRERREIRFELPAGLLEL